jgi:conjugative relaxase-like TrwC/TraI family protein
LPLDIKPLKSPKGIAAYYSDALALSDYHGVAVGIWGGKGAELLGLKGEVTKESFIDLLENRHPFTKERLTGRTKKNRRPAYEVTVSVPKSLTLYMEFSGDEFFKRLPREAFTEIMGEIESCVQTRVRKDGADYNRTTGNWVFAWFIHRESRPVDGISCAQWHIHCIAANATFDEVENQWKALEMGNVKTDAPFYQAAFNSLLAEKLIAHGYAIRPTKDGFELANVSRELIDKFSKRHAKIKELEVALEDVLEQSAVTWSKKSGINYEKTLGKVKAELGKKSREKKSTALLKDEELRTNWRERMTPDERESLQIDKVKAGPSVGFLEAETAKELTIESLKEDHHFGVPDERLSDVKDSSKRPKETRELHLAAAFLRRGLGKVSIAAAKMWAKVVNNLEPIGPKVPRNLEPMVSIEPEPPLVSNGKKLGPFDLIQKALKNVRPPWMEHAMRSQAQRRESIGMER